MEIGIRTVSNPRMKDGWHDEENGCRLCGCISSAYMSISFYKEGSRHVSDVFGVRICKSCLEERIKMINKTILDQAKGLG